MLTDNRKNHQASPSAAPSGSDMGPVPKLQHKAERLRNVAEQVESFLMRQIDRLQLELERAETVGDRNELEELTGEFERMRSKWDAERQGERSRLHEDSERLVEAWQRLEAEQREMLKYRVPSKLSNSGSARPIARSAAGLGPSHPVAVGSAPVLACAGRGATVTGHKNQLQFQQLRREMMEHARQRRKQ